MHEDKRCGAKTRSGRPCANAKMANGRCRMHGGKHPRGIASPNFKHGRYSKHLPGALMGKYHEALSDAALLELRDELAVIDVRLSDLLQSVDAGGASETWKALRRLVRQFKTGPAEGRADALRAILDLIERGGKDWQRWEDVFRTIERRVRVAESERKRLVEMQQMMTSEQAMTLLAAVVDTVRKHVHDREALRGISADLSALVSSGARLEN